MGFEAAGVKGADAALGINSHKIIRTDKLNWLLTVATDGGIPSITRNLPNNNSILYSCSHYANN